MKPSKKLIFNVLVYCFAIFGLVLILAWSAVKLQITNDPGGIDNNDRYFTDLDSTIIQTVADSAKFSSTSSEISELLKQTGELYALYPRDAHRILVHLAQDRSFLTATKMLAALRLNCQENTPTQIDSKTVTRSAFYWINLPEWPVLKEAVTKDKKVIDSVARLTSVSPRLISAVLIAEQIRLFDSRREAFKKWIAPLKMLTSETSFSWGVTGIKDFTAIAIEKNLADTTSVFYAGQQFKGLLQFHSENIESERFERITDSRNHFYAYLYAALFIKQVSAQWQKAGFPIEDRPEILATLFNIGFANSKPKKNPQVGGATIDVGGRKYTFGRIAWEYYYSGELNEVFPLY